ncbi:MAG TPA: hypothetical protein VGX97_05860 [bacterium]|nr:hypothetical protein [bacterium]
MRTSGFSTAGLNPTATNGQRILAGDAGWDISDIHTPDPNKSYDISGVFLQFPIYSRLVKQEAPDLGTIKPDLAASWSINANATAMTFKLRDVAAVGRGLFKP